MTYRELLELYKSGRLNQEEASKIEQDIEKHEAIGDYLYDEQNIPELALMQEDSMENEEDFTRAIQASIREAFWKLGIKVFVVTLIAVFVILGFLPDAVSLLYYNPDKKVGGDTNQMSLDMAVYSDMYLPGYYRDTVTVEKRGYGNYDINIRQNATYNDRFTNVGGKIEKEKLTLYNDSVLRPPSSNSFAWADLNTDKQSSDTKTPITDLIEPLYKKSVAYRERNQRLQDMIPGEKYLCYITPTKQMHYDDLIELLHSYDYYDTFWCAVRTSEDYCDNLGFNYDISSQFLDWDQKKYPNLLLYHADMSEKEFDMVQQKIQTEKFMKKHFLSMLQYLDDNEDFAEMMDLSERDFEAYAEYVKEHGLIVYGFVIVADQKKALEFSKREGIFEVNALPLI